MNEKLNQKLETLPYTSGVYKFLDKDRCILYIGKAINLSKRVKSYFWGDISDRPRIIQMLPLVDDVEIVETNNEIEALVLESALVKKHKPKYNTDLKDDKSYAWIYINHKDKFPTLRIVRSIKKGEFKNGKLFGPYPNGYAVKKVFTYLRKIYPFCTCKGNEKTPCLYFHLGLCPGPYQGYISQEKYRENINEIIKFLNGKQKDHIKRLVEEMKDLSSKERYEDARLIRDRINDLKYLGEHIGFTYYDDIEKYKSKREKDRIKSIKQLEMELNIRNIERIECYDISNIQGKYAYGSMVVAINGELKRSMYRIFSIKTLDTPNDPAMLKEVLIRRVNNIDKNKDESLNSKPSLILIDGSMSQLSVVREYIPKDIYLMGISKGKRLKRAGKKKVDEYWFSDENGIYKVHLDNASILIDLRNEAHRFAISHFRKKISKESKRSILDSIDGVGTVRRKLLIKRFGNVENIKKATLKDIDKVLNNRKISEEIFKYFNH